MKALIHDKCGRAINRRTLFCRGCKVYPQAKELTLYRVAPNGVTSTRVSAGDQRITKAAGK
jgi:hypothetical protein